MRPKTITATMAAADADAISTTQKPTEAGNLTITGTLASGGVATMDYPRHISITSSADDSGRTFTVTGTDRYGEALTESITGPDTTTVKSTKNFNTVTQIAIDDASTGNLTVGTTNELETQWVPLDTYAREISYSVGLSSTANMNYEVEYTLDDVFSSSFTEDGAETFGYGVQGSDQAGKFDKVVTAARLKVTNYVSGTATFRILTCAT